MAIYAQISDKTIKSIKQVFFTTVLDALGVSYKKLGRESVTLCPWHNDSNPSLTISDEKSFCYCFVCAKKGDIIEFVKGYDSLSFSDAVLKIASVSNITVEYDNIDLEKADKERELRKRLIDQVQSNQDYYRHMINDPRASRIRDFLHQRGISGETSKYFGLGYSAMGMFKDRITVPIHNHLGKIVGYTGRATREETKPKYKNSQDDLIFNKSSLIFNEHRATKFIKELDYAIIVEGHFDVIALHQAGIKNVVATQGTAAPSEYTIKRLSLKSKTFVLAYDGDQGGRKAIQLFLSVAGPMACRGEINISVAMLPEGMDPEDCVKNPLYNFISIIENSVSWIDWQLDVWLDNIDKKDTATFSLAENFIRDLVNSIKSPTLRQFYIDKASKKLSSSEDIAVKVAKDWSKTQDFRVSRIWNAPTPAQTREKVERRLVRLYIHKEDLRSELVDLMSKIQNPTYKWAWARIQEIEKIESSASMDQLFLAILMVSEPHYQQRLRPLSLPTVHFKSDPGILTHIKQVLNQELLIEGI